jgi:CheY-like chemotaxis protein
VGDEVEVAVELGSGLPPVKIDPGRMEHVLVNLAVNARHAMPQGGRLAVRTAAVAGEAPHAAVPAGRWAFLSVADTGVGMDAATLARAFEPFFTTRQVGEGTGLGLAGAYGFVKQSGGYIFAESRPGQGARFTMYLPAALPAEEAAPEEAAAQPATSVARGSETVLLVDDEPAVRNVVSGLLHTRGYRVLTAGSGREALALAERHSGALDLLLTDLSMPEMGGRELARRLLATRPSLRVLAMSGQRQEGAPADGQGEVLMKPFSAVELGRAVRAVLSGGGEG